jgi:uncharacterized protein
MDQHKSELRDGMRVEWDVPIPMQDGVVLRGGPAPPSGFPTLPAGGATGQG